MSSDISIVGAGMTRFGRQTDLGLAELATTALATAFEQAGLTAGDMDAVFVSSAVSATVLGQEMVAGQVAIRGSQLSGLPVFNIENACASGQSAFHLACAYVRGGLADTVVVLGVERMSHADKSRAMRALAGAVDVKELGSPESKPPGHSFFMDLYAQKARAQLERGDTREDFAAVVVKNQANGALNPRAQYGGTVTVDEVLAGRMIVDPLTLTMCSPISDGAAAVIVTTSSRAALLPRSVDILATSVMSGGDLSDTATASSRAAVAAYNEAGIGPTDLSLIELHDAAAPAEIELYEELGLAERGSGASLLRSGSTLLGGRLPVNASGGLLAKGHPVGATGVAQLVEGFEQLTAQSGARQVNNATFFLAHNSGGWVGHDNAAASVSILGRSRR